MRIPVYHSREIQAWEQRWFARQNSALGLMQQVAWSVAQQLHHYILKNSLSIKTIAVWCGTGNNAGDGYYTASYLKQYGYEVDIFAAALGQSADLKQAYEDAQQQSLNIHHHFEVGDQFDCHIDALFGIGLNRDLDQNWQDIISRFNQKSGLKISIDIPSGLQANTGCVLPQAIKADITYTALGAKTGLFTGQAREYVGRLEILSLIPVDHELEPLGYLTTPKVILPKRKAFEHKGSYGHVLVVGGHANMGGAVIMAAEAAFHAGAGKVTILCDGVHHAAILARAPNIMVQNINHLTLKDIEKWLGRVDAVCFGMGLGRDSWAENIFNNWFKQMLQQTELDIVLDADALWFLADHQAELSPVFYLTPHSGEAARLLDTTIQAVEEDRLAAIYQLQQRYRGQWVLKGAGSLILENGQLSICSTGNAGMGTGGMGDVLAGMIASLKAQFHKQIGLDDIVTLHGQAGDVLAEHGQRGVQAHLMANAIYQVVNQ